MRTTFKSLREVSFMPSSPFISIIIPVYNRPELLQRTLTSVLSQSFQDFEVLIVDDASTTPLPKNFPDKRIRLIKLPINQGAAAARNVGIKAAIGTYIAFLDSDDTWESAYLKTQAAALKNLSSSYGGSITGFRFITKNKTTSYAPHLPSNQFLYFLGGCFISPGSSLIVKKDVFTAVGFFNETFRRLEDWEWLLRFSQKYTLFSIPDILVNVHGNEGPASSLIQKNLEVLRKAILPTLQENSSYKNRFLAALELEKASIAKRSNSYFSCSIFILRALFYDYTYTQQRLSSIWRTFS